MLKVNIERGTRRCFAEVSESRHSPLVLVGYIVSERGIKANPEKITTISNMGPIRNVMGVQRLTDCLVALS